MIDRLVHDIRKALENELYFVALNSAIILPDICGKAAYPTEKSTKKRYISWYDEEIGKDEKAPNDKYNMPYLSGEVIYNLRCSLLHAGNPNIEADKLRDEIDHFSLIIEKANPFEVYSDESVVEEGIAHKREYSMNVRRVCMILCIVAENYYRNNKDKFQFNYEIIDKDEEHSDLSTIDIGEIVEHIKKENSKYHQQER